MEVHTIETLFRIPNKTLSFLFWVSFIHYTCRVWAKCNGIMGDFHWYCKLFQLLRMLAKPPSHIYANDYPSANFQDIRDFRVQKVSLKIEYKLWYSWEQCSWPNPKYYLIGSKNLLTLTFIKSMLNKRKQIQQFFSLLNPRPFCWTHPFKYDLLPVSCSTFIHWSRSFFVLQKLPYQTDKSYFMGICTV